MEHKKESLGERYEIGLIIVSIMIILGVMLGLTLFPTQGKDMGAAIMQFITHTFGSVVQLFTIVVLLFLIALAFSKYGNIRFGNTKPDYSTASWVAMMFFSGLGAGTVYWAFLEWGYHFNAAPALAGTKISEAYAYEMSLAYTVYDWGLAAWALLCVFVFPFAYHYYIKKNNELTMAALCQYSLGEKFVHGWFGKIINFIFIFAAVGSICISAGTSAPTIAAAIADFVGIQTSFALVVVILLAVALLYTVCELLRMSGIIQKISSMNVYFCCALLVFILVAGNTQYILDSMINSLSILSRDYGRMTLWTDPVNKSGYPQDWTVFYLVYWLVFGPFTGLFVAKISKGRTIKEIVLNMLVTGSTGLFLFFGIVSAYQQDMRIKGLLDIPAMLANGKNEFIATQTIHTLPFSKIAMLLYIVVIFLFLAAALNATSVTLSTAVSKKLKQGEEVNSKLKLFWCLLLVAIPIGTSFVGTDIPTIKAIVLTTGLPLIAILIIIYHGFLKELVKDYGAKSKEEIIEESRITK